MHTATARLPPASEALTPAAPCTLHTLSASNDESLLHPMVPPGLVYWLLHAPMPKATVAAQRARTVLLGPKDPQAPQAGLGPALDVGRAQVLHAGQGSAPDQPPDQGLGQQGSCKGARAQSQGREKGGEGAAGRGGASAGAGASIGPGAHSKAQGIEPEGPLPPPLPSQGEVGHGSSPGVHEPSQRPQHHPELPPALPAPGPCQQQQQQRLSDQEQQKEQPTSGVSLGVCEREEEEHYQQRQQQRQQQQASRHKTARQEQGQSRLMGIFGRMGSGLEHKDKRSVRVGNVHVQARPEETRWPLCALLVCLL